MDVWQEGKYIDLWTVNHTLAGAGLAGLFLLFDWSFILGVSLISVLSVLWEFYEIKKGIEETAGNRVMDVVTGVLGYIGFHFLVMDASFKSKLVNFIIVAVVWTILEAWGYSTYKKRAATR